MDFINYERHLYDNFISYIELYFTKINTSHTNFLLPYLKNWNNLKKTIDNKTFQYIIIEIIGLLEIINKVNDNQFENLCNNYIYDGLIIINDILQHNEPLQFNDINYLFKHIDVINYNKFLNFIFKSTFNYITNMTFLYDHNIKQSLLIFHSFIK